MEKFNYEITIKASPDKIWKVLIEREHFQKWSTGFAEGSDFTGKWEVGKTITFTAKDGGTVARIDSYNPPQGLEMTHVEVLDAGGGPSEGGEWAEKWVGSKEAYVLTESKGATKLEVKMLSDAEFKDMIDKGWTSSLELIKKLAEED